VSVPCLTTLGLEVLECYRHMQALAAGAKSVPRLEKFNTSESRKASPTRSTRPLPPPSTKRILPSLENPAAVHCRPLRALHRTLSAPPCSRPSRRLPLLLDLRLATTPATENSGLLLLFWRHPARSSRRRITSAVHVSHSEPEGR